MSMQQNPYDPPVSQPAVPLRRRSRMNVLDKICAGLAVPLAVVLVLLGGFGLFFGCSANFTLPPIFGFLPVVMGWGIIRSVSIAWTANREEVFDARASEPSS